DVTVGGIHGHVRRLVQERPALVCVRVGPRIAASVIVCRPVAHSLAADLQQQGLTIVRVLLHDAIPIAGDPNVVLVIDEAPVDAIWQDVRVTPRVYYVTVAIVLDDRW